MNKFLTRKNILYSLYLFISVILCLELLLHIYNPFHFRIKGNEIIIEANKKYVIDNSLIPVLDKSIVHSKNGLGFRGPEKPDDYTKKLTIIAVGGSATECMYLDDSKTWPEVLYKKLQQPFPDVWLNNAGLGGHSTFGHISLMKDHIVALRPKYVILLVGANDIRRGRLAADNSFAGLLSRYSELANVVSNLSRSREARKKNLTDTYIDMKKADSLVLSDSIINVNLSDEAQWVQQYKDRLKTIIDLCRTNDIRPIFITQPTLVGSGTDPVTGVSLEHIRLSEKENGKLWWTKLEKYNDGTRAIAHQEKVPLIDLARILPKSSAYFYDVVHFTNDGAEKTASILYDSLVPILHR